jgi:hypothetical protein
MNSRFASNSSAAFPHSSGGPTKPHLLHGVGYIIPPNDKLYDSEGNRIVDLSQKTHDAYIAAGRSLADPGLRFDFYNEPAVLCTEGEFNAFHVTGKKMALHHDENRIVGQILQASVENNEVLLTASITDPEVAKKIENMGDRAARAFSIGMLVKLDGRRVIGKEFREFSIVDEPYYPGCYTRVVAGKEGETLEEGVVGVYLSAGHGDAFPAAEGIF